MIEWASVALVFVLELMSKAGFWICVCIFWAAKIVTDSIEQAVRDLSEKADELLEELKPPRG